MFDFIIISSLVSHPGFHVDGGTTLHLVNPMYITHIATLTDSHTYNIHSNSSALKDYRDYTGITRSKSLNLCRPPCMSVLASFENEGV